MTSSHPTRTALAASAVFLSTIAIALTGCSSSESSKSDDDATGAAVVSPPTIMTADKLTICTSDSPPNIYYDDDNQLQGVEIDLADGLAKNLGLTTKLEEYNFSGLIPALQAKQCDVIMGSLYIKPEREEIANFVPYLYSGTAVGVSKENPQGITGIDDSLCGTNVVAITGATGATTAESTSKQCETDGKKPIEITLVDDGAAAVQQTIAGQVDAFIDTTEIMSFYGKESDGAFQSVGEPSDKIRIGAATLKNNEDLNEALDTAFTKLVDDGDYASILEKWDVESNDITVAE